MQDDKLVAVYSTMVTDSSSQKLCNEMSHRPNAGLYTGGMNEKEVLVALNVAKYLIVLIKKIEQLLKRIRSVPTKIVSISKVRDAECEWCSNMSYSVDISFGRTSDYDFHGGFCCCGGGTYFADNSFRPQGDWHVCGKEDCKEPEE